MAKKYGAVGGLFANKLEFADGRTVGPVMGGASIYALSAFLFKTDNVLLISGVGKDVDKYYGQWFDENKIDRKALMIRIDKNEYSFIHYYKDGTWDAGSTYGPEFRKNELPKCRLKFTDIKEYLEELDAVYFCGYSLDEIEELLNLKNKHPLTVMWEMPTHLAADGVEVVKEYLRAADIWSLNKPESFELFNCTNEKDVLKQLINLGKPCFYRVGDQGSYMVRNKEVYFVPATIREDGVDPTGCGNSSTAAALYAFAEGYSTSQIAALANTIASFTVRQYGPYPRFDDSVRKEAEGVYENNLTLAKKVNMLREEEFSLVEQDKIASDIGLQVFEYNKQGYSNYFGLNEEYVKDIRSIEITGCGDSWMTSNAVKALFEKLTGLNTNARRPIELSRYCDYSQLDNPLFIGVTISGGVARTRECLIKAKNKGYKIFAVTNGLNSPTAEIVDSLAHIGMPPGLKSGYGLHSYDCSVITLIYTACAIGVLRKHITTEKAQEVLDSLKGYIETYKKFVEDSLPVQEQLAEKIYNSDYFLFVGEGYDYSNAYFSCANIFEEIGETSNGYDTLNFKYACVNYANPEKISTTFFINSYNLAKDVQLENIKLAIEKKYQVSIITDIEDLTIEGATLIRTPKPAYNFFNGALQHLAFDGCVGYIRQKRNCISFCAEDERYHTEDVKDRLKKTAMLLD